MTDAATHTAPPLPNRPSPLASAVPVGVSYLLLPAALSLLPLLPIETQDWPGPAPLIWGALAAFGAFWLVWVKVHPATQEPSALRTIVRGFEVALVLTTAILAFGALQDWAGPQAASYRLPLRWLDEAAPLVFLGFAGLWCLSFGVPRRSAFRRSGLILAVLVIIDVAWGTVDRGWLLPAEGFLLLPDVPFGRDILACLLGVSLMAGLDDERPDQLGHRPMRWADTVLILALSLTFSRTALFAVACVWIFLGRGPSWQRLLFALLMLGATALSLLTVLPLRADTLDLSGHILWIAGVEHFMNRPELLLYIQGLGPFSLSMPSTIAANMGIGARTELLMPQQIHSLWLRLALVWGGWGLGAIMLSFTLPALLRPTRFVSGLVALMVTQGTVFGLLFRAEVAVVLWLALMAGIAAWKPQVEREEDASDPWFALDQDTDAKR